jgi:peptide/nickel transport system permease protein
VFAAIVVIAVLAPWISPHDTSKQDLLNTFAPPSTSGYWMGTDELGRDVLSRVIGGARISLFTGIVSALISVAIGLPLGLVAGFFAGRTDMLLGRLFDAVLGIPSILMALGLSAVLGPSLWVIVVSLGAVWWASYARIVRSEALSLAQAQFIEAARSTGCTNWRLIFRYMLPNVMPIIIALAPLTIASGILVEASLSFLGVGVRPPTPTWGAMLSIGRNYVRSAWWLSTFPGLAIVLTILCLNLLGDGLRDKTDPKLQR